MIIGGVYWRQKLDLTTFVAAVDRHLLPAGHSAANPPAAAHAVDGWDRQTDA